mgnify:CR=1 FL=1
MSKIIHVQNAHFLGHSGNGVVVLHQQLGRTVDALGVDIIDQGAAGLLLEQCRQVRWADEAHGGQTFQRQRLGLCYYLQREHEMCLFAL